MPEGCKRPFGVCTYTSPLGEKSMRTTSSVALGLALMVIGAPRIFAANTNNEAARIFSSAISATGLDEERGGKAAEGQTQIFNINNTTNNTQIFSTNNVKGSVDNVTVINSNTGHNTIDGGSFANSNGFPMAIQNTGNGVVIQNSTILNVTIEK
jgi:hypothetical protein